jgi:hypothetical protein
MVRYLLVDDLFTEAAARLMIEDTRPVWNTMLMEGFGAHPAAATRGGVFNSRGRPAWYYVHGGRGSWPSGLDALPDPPEELLEGVRDHFRAMAAGSVVGTALPR